MSEKRFVRNEEEDYESCWDNEEDEILYIPEIIPLLNSLWEENEQLRQELQKKQEEERLYANEIVELNKTKNEMLNFKELGGDY